MRRWRRFSSGRKGFTFAVELDRFPAKGNDAAPVYGTQNQRFAEDRDLCEYSGMGILDDNTLSILRDGRVIDTMHRLSECNPDKAAEQGVKLDVRIRDKRGAEHVKQVILKKVRS